MIEAKKLGPFTIRRPFHWLCVVNVGSVLYSALSSGFGVQILTASTAVYLGSLIGIGYKFVSPDFRLIKDEGFFQVLFQTVRAPFVYLFWLKKGCIRFGSWPLY
jgi:hypothetical protein